MSLMKPFGKMKNNHNATVNTLTMKGCVTMPLPQQNNQYTIDDIYALPDGQRAELIDGQMYMMAPPTRRHQQILGALYRKIADYIDRKGGSCEVDIAPFAVFLNADDKNYVEPDISVICSPEKLTDKGCTGAPDWIIEIVSPGSRRTDYFTKLFKYRTAGVREYWIVDPEKNRITVYTFESEDTAEYTFTDFVKAGIYEDLEIDFNTIEL
jgi:Uma2 family endonuclease